MSASGKKIWLAILVAVVLLSIGAVFCYIPLTQFHRAGLIRKFIEELPGTLQVESVTVDMLADSVELRGLSGTVEFFQGMPFDINARQIRLEGLRWDQAETGSKKVAERVVAENLSFTPGTAFSSITGYSAATVSGYSVKGVWLDWGLLRQAGAMGTHSKAFADFLLSLKLGETSVRDASLKITERPASGQPIGGDYIIAVSRLEMESYSLRSTGKSKTWNYSQVYASGARFTAREISFASRAIPSGTLRLMLSGLRDGQRFSRENSLELLKEGYSLRSLDCKELLVVNASGESLYVPSLLADMDIGNGNLLLKLDAPDIWVSGSLLAGAVSNIDDRLGFLSDRKLHFSSLIDWKVEPVKEGTLRLICHQELHETRLGSMILHTIFSGSEAVSSERILPFAPDSLAFETGILELEDDSFLHDFFSFDPKRALDEGGKADALSTARSTIVDVVRNSQTGMPAFLSGVTGRFAQFIEKSGFLSVQAECSPPLPVLEALNDPAKLEKLSVKATYSQ